MTEPLFHPLNPQHYLDPLERLAQLRKTCPVSAPVPWMVLMVKDGDIRAAMRNYSAFSNVGNLIFPETPENPPTILQLDPPEHTRMRQLQTHASPMMVTRFQSAIQQVVDGLLAHFSGVTSADMMAEFAYPLPVLVTLDLLGIPKEEREQFYTWVCEIKDYLPYEYARLESWQHFTEYVRMLIQQRRREQEPPPDMLTHLIQSEYHGERLSDDDIRMAIFQIIGGGTNAISYLLGNCLYTLLEQRALWERVVAQPEMFITSAIEESLRLDPPTPWVIRICRKETVVGDTKIAAGKRVILSLTSANRDERSWSEPDVFSLDRKGQTHLSFGYGNHFCLGASLARLEANIALTALVTHFPSLRLSSDFRYQPVTAAMWHGPQRLDVCWEP